MQKKDKKPRTRLKIPLDFKQALQAALETRPEPKKNPRKKAGKTAVKGRDSGDVQ